MSSKGWQTKRLGDLINLEYGFGLTKGTRAGYGYAVFGSSGEVGRHDIYRVEGPGIVVGRKGTIGAVIWSDDPFYPIDTTYFVQTREDIDLRWLYWLLDHLPLQDLDASTGVPGLNRNDVYAIELPVPTDKSEQQLLADILDTIDAAIQHTQAVIDKLKEVRAGLLHDLLTYGIDANGDLRDPVQHPEQFKESALGLIPVEWEVTTLSEIASLHGGKRLPAGHDYSPTPTPYRYFRIVDFYEGYDTLKYLDESTFKVLARYEIQPGDLYISIAGVLLGVIGLFDPPESYERTVLTENCARIVLNDVLLPRYTVLQMNEQKVQHLIWQQKGTSGGVPKLALHRVNSLKLAVPSEAEQQYVVQNVSELDQRIASEDGIKAKLDLIKDGLASDLLTGTVRVSHLIDSHK